MKPNYKAPLITFEGPEGCGKSTALSGIISHLQSLGYDPLLFREPGGTPIGERVREILLDTASKEMEPMTEALLMQASRAQLVYEKIHPALKEGRLVLLDRYYDSSTAYQGFGREMGPEIIEQLNRISTGNLVPNRTYLFTLPRSTARQRLSGRLGKNDRLDQEVEAFHARVYKGYDYVVKTNPDRFVVIDGTPSPEVVLKSVVDDLTGFLKEHYAHLSL